MLLVVASGLEQATPANTGLLRGGEGRGTQIKTGFRGATLPAVGGRSTEDVQKKRQARRKRSRRQWRDSISKLKNLSNRIKPRRWTHGDAGRLQSATKIASRRQEGSGYPDLPIPSIRVGRKAAFAKWFEDGADREKLISIMIQSILTNSVGAWKREQDTDRSQAEEGSKPTGTRTTGRVLCWEIRRRWLRKARHRHLKDNVFRMLWRPVRQDHLVFCFHLFSVSCLACAYSTDRNFGSKSGCVVPKFGAVYSVATWCLADGYSLHVFLHSLVVAFGHR